MPFEKSAGAIIFFHGSEGEIEYLLLRGSRGSNNWTLAKGLIEPGENLKNSALREIIEETGIKNEDLSVVNGFKETIRYFFRAKYKYQMERGMRPGQAVMKFVTYFLAESKIKSVKLSYEHDAYEWLEFSKAYQRLLKSSKQNAEVLNKAHNFLKKNDRIPEKSI